MKCRNIDLFDDTFLNRVVERLAPGDTHLAGRLLKAIVIVNGLLILLGVLCLFVGLPIIGLVVMALVLSELGLARWLDNARRRAIAWWSAALCIALFIPAGFSLQSGLGFMVLFALSIFGLASITVALWPTRDRNK